MHTKILMVCLGNICRSPLAEGILRSKVDKSKVTVDSAATSNWHIGKTPDPRSISIAKEFGVDISTLIVRQFTVQDFEDFDIIFVMDESNYKDVISLSRDDKDTKKVNKILDSLQDGNNLDVPDPYYGEKDGFLEVYKKLEEAIEVIIRELKLA